MKKSLLNVFLFILSVTSINTLTAQNTWKQKADYAGGNRIGTSAFSFGTTGYMMTGNDSAVTADIWAWDQSSNIWTQRNTFPGGRRTGASTVTMFGKAYLIGGEHPSNCFLEGRIGGGVCGGTFYQEIWQYSPDSDQWISLAPFPGTGRDFAVAVADSLDSTIYYGTGNNGFIFLADWWGYNITTNTWTQLDSLPAGKNDAVGFFVNGGVYVGTGDNNDGKEDASVDMWKYDVKGNTWNKVANIPGDPRREGISFVIGNMAYVGLGERSTGIALNDLWMYDAASDKWTQEANYPPGGSGFASAFTIGNKGYVGTGLLIGRDTSVFWEYSPADSLTAINKITPTQSISLYPSPNNGAFIISITNYVPIAIGIGITDQELGIEVYNVLGEKVYSQFSIHHSKFSINICEQPAGVYFYQLTASGKTTYTGKFVIVK